MDQQEFLQDPTAPEAPAEKPKHSRMVTLADLGSTLPVIPRDSQGNPIKDRSFSFLSWDMEMEEAISEIQGKAKNVGEFVNKMMGKLLDTFCGQDFQKLTPEERTLKVSQLEFSNVMYMYIFLRVEELGKVLKFDVTCPSCRKVNKDYEADLETLEVNCKDPEHQRRHTYELVKPVLLSDGQKISAFDYDVSKWDYMERITKELDGNAGKIKGLMLQASICGFRNDGEVIKKFIDPKAFLKRLKKVDIEKALVAVTQNNAGPDMRIGGKCVHCKADFVRAIDWTYQSFFDSSSL